MNPSLVSIRHLGVSLGGHSILEDVNADLPRGQVTAIIGLNGAGKTTLLRALIKEIPYTGEVRFHCGHDHTHPQPRYVGYVPQRLRIENNLPLTVLDLFALSLGKWPLFFGISRAFREQVRGQLAKVGIAELIDMPCNSPPLSGGQLQRVLLALALEPHPELLLLDEPAQGIDFHTREGFYDLIARLNKEMGVTVVLVSHDVSIVSQVAHRVLCVKDRRIECQGEPQAILTGEMLSRVFGNDTGLFVHRHD